MTKSGSAKPGPSPAYLRLLEGKITSKEYTEHVRRSVARKIAVPLPRKVAAE